MADTNFRKLTGIFFIVGAVLVNVPYTLLFVNFDYPDILRQPSAEILTKFHTGGDSLIYSWLAFSWVGLPILLGTAISNFPVVSWAGLLGSLSWLVWMIIVGVFLVKYN